MDTNYIGQLIAGAAYLIVGLGLIRLCLRTSQTPEKLLGIYFLFTGMDYVLYATPRAAGVDSIYDVTDTCARVSYAIAVVALMLFTREVFRKSGNWAGWLTRILSVAILIGLVGSMAVGEWDGGESDSLWFWCYYLGYTGPCIWVTWEAAIALAAARKRERLGLCPPILLNRYLLWLAFGSFQVLACAALFFAEGMPISDSLAGALDSLLGVIELASIAAVWLAFFAPRSYRNWISREPAHAAS